MKQLPDEFLIREKFYLKRKDISLKDIKLIVTDIDGTLLNDDGELGQESKKLIKELMNENVVSLATRRLHSAVIEIANELTLNGYIISLDGAMVKSFSDDKTLFESFLKKCQVKKAIEISESLLIKIALCHTSSIYYTEYNTVIPSLLSKYGAFYTPVDSYQDYISGTLEIVCSSDMKGSIKQMEEKFNFPYSLGCNTSYFRSKKNENIFYLEMLVREGRVRSFEFKWIGDYNVSDLRLSLSLPRDSLEINTSPALSPMELQPARGLLVGTASKSDLKMGSSYQFKLEYARDSDTLADPNQASQVNPSGPLNSETEGRVSVDNLPWIIGGIGIGLIGLALLIYWRSTRVNSGASKHPRNRRQGSRSPEDAGQLMYCHECGTRSNPGERFCRTCGSRLRNE